MPELYSIVRGKAGKSVEFGLKWGINHVDGFILGFLIENGVHASDKRFCIEAIKEHKGLFGKAPTGKTEWSVSEKMSKKIARARAQVEGLIGNSKSKKYGFNKPNVKSTVAMETSAHRSFLGMNLSKTISRMHLQELQTA